MKLTDYPLFERGQKVRLKGRIKAPLPDKVYTIRKVIRNDNEYNALYVGDDTCVLYSIGQGNLAFWVTFDEIVLAKEQGHEDSSLSSY